VKSCIGKSQIYPDFFLNVLGVDGNKKENYLLPTVPLLQLEMLIFITDEVYGVNKALWCDYVKYIVKTMLYYKQYA